MNRWGDESLKSMVTITTLMDVTHGREKNDGIVERRSFYIRSSARGTESVKTYNIIMYSIKGLNLQFIYTN